MSSTKKDLKVDFQKLVVRMENMILTGLRGVGKTVLLERFKPLAQSAVTTRS